MCVAITPDEFEERLLTISETASTDRECRCEMHLLVVELLTALGYDAGADIYAEAVIER